MSSLFLFVARELQRAAPELLGLEERGVKRVELARELVQRSARGRGLLYRDDLRDARDECFDLRRRGLDSTGEHLVREREALSRRRRRDRRHDGRLVREAAQRARGTARLTLDG